MFVFRVTISQYQCQTKPPHIDTAHIDTAHIDTPKSVNFRPKITPKIAVFSTENHPKTPIFRPLRGRYLLPNALRLFSVLMKTFGLMITIII